MSFSDYGCNCVQITAVNTFVKRLLPFLAKGDYGAGCGCVRRLQCNIDSSATVPMPYTPILATLGFVLSQDRRRVLMIHRNARTGDHHLGKYNGLGGKLEANEDIVAGMRREIHEEAGIDCLDLRLRGTISWPGFGKQGEDWLGFVFVIDRYRGEAFTENVEGSLQWVDIDKMLDLPLWDGDRHFLPLVFDDDPRAFHGVMPYRDGSMLSWAYSRL